MGSTQNLEMPMPAKAVAEKPGETLAELMKTDKSTWVMSSIPAEDIVGSAHPSVTLNGYTFEAGKTYLVPKRVADYINDRVKVFAKSCIRLFRPNLDTDAQMRVSMGSTNAMAIGAQPTTGSMIVNGAKTSDGEVYTIP